MKEMDEKLRELAKTLELGKSAAPVTQADPTWPATREERLRKLYRPAEIKVLFVGESPPQKTFFYDAESVPSKLHQHTLEAFRRVYGTGIGRGRAFLEFFKAHGCYLDDLVWVQGKPNRTLKERGVMPLANRMKEYSPKVVIVVIKQIKGHVLRAMKAAGLGDIPCDILPFPAYGNEQRYVQELADIVRDLKKQEILLDT